MTSYSRREIDVKSKVQLQSALIRGHVTVEYSFAVFLRPVCFFCDSFCAPEVFALKLFYFSEAFSKRPLTTFCALVSEAPPFVHPLVCTLTDNLRKRFFLYCSYVSLRELEWYKYIVFFNQLNDVKIVFL